MDLSSWRDQFYTRGCELRGASAYKHIFAWTGWGTLIDQKADTQGKLLHRPFCSMPLCPARWSESNKQYDDTCALISRWLSAEAFEGPGFK